MADWLFGLCAAWDRCAPVVPLFGELMGVIAGLGEYIFGAGSFQIDRLFLYCNQPLKGTEMGWSPTPSLPTSPMEYVLSTKGDDRFMEALAKQGALKRDREEEETEEVHKMLLGPKTKRRAVEPGSDILSGTWCGSMRAA
jgi:hypothetical protein